MLDPELIVPKSSNSLRTKRVMPVILNASGLKFNADAVTRKPKYPKIWISSRYTDYPTKSAKR